MTEKQGGAMVWPDDVLTGEYLNVLRDRVSSGDLDALVVTLALAESPRAMVRRGAIFVISEASNHLPLTDAVVETLLSDPEPAVRDGALEYVSMWADMVPYSALESATVLAHDGDLTIRDAYEQHRECIEAAILSRRGVET
jgi:hypothetical protein